MGTDVQVQTYEPAPAVSVTPVPPLGAPSTTVSVYDVAATGAILAAMGMEKSSVTSLLHEFQAATNRAFLSALPGLLDKLRGVQEARLKRVIQEIRALPEAVVPQGLLSRLMSGPTMVIDSLVRREDVLRILTVALVEQPTTSV